MLTQPVVRLMGLSVFVNNRQLIDNLALEILGGERTAVIGQVGSGKSLLLELISGRHVPHQGHLSYPAWVSSHPDAALGVPPRFAVSLVSTNEQRRACSRVADFYQARWHSAAVKPGTVAAFLELREVIGLRPYEVAPAALNFREFAEQRAALLDELGIDYLLTRPLLGLSNGEWRLLLLARALLARPQLLLLDDPLGGLDPDARTRVVRVLQRQLDAGLLSSTSLLADPSRELSAAAATLVMTTPRPDELAALTTRFVELSAGHAPTPRKTKETTHQPPSTSGCGATDDAKSSPVVSLRAATVRAMDSLLLDAVSLQVLPGQHWLITGPNGSGKSTLLSLIMGDHPQCYVVDLEVLGKRAQPGVSLLERQRGIGLIAPELIMHYPMQWSIREVVLSGLRGSIGQYADPSSLDLQWADYWLQRFDLRDAQHAAVATLCEVDLRKVFVARALIKRPALLLLDEPTQGLPAEARAQVHDLLDEVVSETRATLLMVSHHASERPQCITHQLALDRGRVVYSGAVREQ